MLNCLTGSVWIFHKRMEKTKLLIRYLSEYGIMLILLSISYMKTVFQNPSLKYINSAWIEHKTPSHPKIVPWQHWQFKTLCYDSTNHVNNPPFPSSTNFWNFPHLFCSMKNSHFCSHLRIKYLSKEEAHQMNL